MARPHVEPKKIRSITRNTYISQHPHPIKKMLAKIRKAVQIYPKAMLFELRDRGYASLFEQLIACMISIRTLDEVSLPTSLKLFAKARNPRDMLKLSKDEIAAAIHGATFAYRKAERILQISKIIKEEFGWEMPQTFETLTSLPGVGPKCANLVLGIAGATPAIGVDVHVHRITNRWGYAAAPTPEKTLSQLEEKLPIEHWVEINELLVPFGKHICTGRLPKCSTCPVLENCDQRGVGKHL